MLTRAGMLTMYLCLLKDGLAARYKVLEKSSSFRRAVFVRSTDDRLSVLVRSLYPPIPHENCTRVEETGVAKEERDHTAAASSRQDEISDIDEDDAVAPIADVPLNEWNNGSSRASEGRGGAIIPSLQVICEQQMAKAISLKNLGAIFNAALFLRLPELSRYCSNFVLA